MKRKCYLSAAAICVTFSVLSGCSGSRASEEGEPVQLQSIQSEAEIQSPASDLSRQEENAENTTEERTDAENAKEVQNDAELEEELARYRQEREDNIQESNGLVEGGSPNEANYTFDLSGTNDYAQFDSREATQAFAAARIYVTDTLGIKPKTKMAVYMCVDPRILSIYDDEDKGAAAGYDNSNIFVCEYCDENNIWKYLILVRDGKGSQWEVIHSGSSYKE